MKIKLNEIDERPWEKEPNELEWVDLSTGFLCKIRRNTFKALCGYVGVPKKHFLYKTDYNEIALQNIRVHGGLTFSGWIENKRKYWFFGFDCAHYNDYLPDVPLFSAREDAIYRDINYVSEQCTHLALQLSEIKSL